jgi:transposase-like protein
MARQRRKFSPQFKAEAVQFVIEMEDEIRRLRIENEFSNEAAAFFAKRR